MLFPLLFQIKLLKWKPRKTQLRRIRRPSSVPSGSAVTEPTTSSFPLRTQTSAQPSHADSEKLIIYCLLSAKKRKKEKATLMKKQSDNAEGIILSPMQTIPPWYLNHKQRRVLSPLRQGDLFYRRAPGRQALTELMVSSPRGTDTIFLISVEFLASSCPAELGFRAVMVFHHRSAPVQEHLVTS